MMKSHQPAKKLVALQLDQNLLAIIDQAAQRQFRSRWVGFGQAMLRELEAQGTCPVAA